MIDQLVTSWEAIKHAGLPDGQAIRATMHFHLGLGIYLLVGAFTRQGLRSRAGLVLISLLEIGNEILDLARFFPKIPAWLWHDTLADLFNTLFWPVVLYALAGLWERRKAGTASASSAVSSASAADGDVS
ncbi:hypothetical protein GRI97_08960 [Altererythrobacter xixiisoli]|uniref:VanZ-like domain-containing protein n=2 Tax=Croceibacterium xixiisoli TaxID=1476466 RepID=A0A6I4TWG2_9SPHN|nr:hypothetical protein [Croceibacterium xixiisoli]